MFSKALFKQSCKANGLLWAIITFATCFMLACVMIISGNGNLTKLTGSMSSSIIESTVESTMEQTALSYYVASNKMGTIILGFANTGMITDENFDTMYDNFIPMLPKLIQRELDITEEEANQLSPFIIRVFNKDHQAISEDVQPENFKDVVLSKDADRMSNYVQKNVSILVAQDMTSDDYIQLILASLSDYGITADGYADFTYEKTNSETGEKTEVSKFVGEDGKEYIDHLSNSAIVTLRARLEYEISQGKDETTATEEIIGDLTATFLSTLPNELAQSLQEIGELDIYSMIVGTIFYNIAGLLLPMIYMVMVANNLIAGQVDRGSMAYVLSTSVKRRQVVFTQAVYLIGSLFAMFACTTLTSVVCLACLNGSNITLGYGELLLLNLGAFIAMFAMSGISYLTSCWFNRTKYSLGIGGGLNIFFLVATILGLFGSSAMPSVVRLDSLNFFNYVSLISLFDVTSILNGTVAFIWKLAILLGVGIICYIIGGRKFEKKDLPL